MSYAESPSPPTRNDLRDGWLLAVACFAALCLVAAVAAAAYASRVGGSSAANTSATGQVVTFDLMLTEFAITPSTIEVPAGAMVHVRVKNSGTMPHDVKWNGTTGTEMIDPGATADADFGVINADGQAWCTVPGHKRLGMVLDVKVTGGSATALAAGGTTSGATASATSSGATATNAGSTNPVSADAKITPNATPAATWKAYDPTLKPTEGGTEHKLTLHATEEVKEVAPGVTQELWTFGGQVPGPTLHGKIGDIFTITLVNDGKLGHSIDLHASKVAWSDEMRTIKPGESLVYQFQAKFAGAFMYHCGTAPALHHIGNGMYGAIIIDPPNLPRVDHEFLMVQSELYLGPQGQPGDYNKMTSANYDAVVFNGYYNQYAFAPIRVEPNQRIRVWVVDDGPSENSAFHIVGTVFDTVWKEGAYLLQPDATHGGSQVLDLQPAQGGFVEFSFDEAGTYLMVTHKFSNVGKGALGMFQAGDAAAPATGGTAH